jgi:hypothetical protein
MAKWKAKVYIGDLHAQYQDGEISPNDLSLAVAARLRKTRYEPEFVEMLLLDEFEAVETIDEYDECLAVLYDFADANHRLWVDSSNTAWGMT